MSHVHVKINFSFGIDAKVSINVYKYGPWNGGPERQLYAGVSYVPQSGTMNLATAYKGSPSLDSVIFKTFASGFSMDREV